ncbi:unnamed protein product [Caenorhabditis auriculariae]|uniref:phosphatidylinositol 3-kinase n=1 Tax=Caenorhabditis auriculariae TaxID=2777116 RepID=A0A8S1GTX2_9PELO|nr:unnamed protein product [Caenorhabditis auriculariae]
MSEDDAEFQLALELSRKTFAEEEQRRTLAQNDGDLIRFESPDDPQRRAHINQIKRLYSQNSFDQSPSFVTGSVPIGWRTTSFDHTPTSPSLPQPRFHFGSSTSTSHFPQPTTPIAHSFSTPFLFSGVQRTLSPPPPSLAPPPRPPKPPSLRRSAFPDFPSLRDPPPTLPPRSNRPPSTHFNNSTLTQPHFSLDSNFFVSPIRPAHHSFQPYNDSANDSTSPYQPITHLYVPYTMTNLNESYEALLHGDLIDLSATESEGSEMPSIDQIRREFDPLYRPSVVDDRILNFKLNPSEGFNHAPSPTDLPPPPLPPRQSQIIESTKPVVEDREISLNDFKLGECKNPIDMQVEKLKVGEFIKKDKMSEFFIAQTVDYMTTSANSVKVVIQKEHRFPRSDKKEKAMVCEIDGTIEEITLAALYEFLDEEKAAKVNVEDYGLKIVGLNQFLARYSTLGQNLYTGHCLLHGEDVKLERIVSWLISNLNIESTILTIQLSKASGRVKQVVSLICKLLSGIVPDKLYTFLHKYLSNMDYDQLMKSRNAFLLELRSFIEIYCRCTTSSYRLPSLNKKPKPVEDVVEQRDYLKIMANSIHSIPEEWIGEYQEFYISLDLYYGTQVLDGYSSKVARAVRNDQFFPRIQLDLYAEFRRMELCIYPRETRIVFSLSALMSTAADDHGQTISKLLAYVSVPLYDENLLMRQGPIFLPLTRLKREPVVKPFGPYPYIKDVRDPVLIMSFKIWNKELHFPSVTPEMQIIPQDITMLDEETREYLLEMVDKEDPTRLVQDDQEIFWQKRMYLVGIPEALPLVLSSLSDWSYTFLVQVHQLLDVWAPLRPETALQLLLPQYPDEHVRSRAVKWLSSASSEFLFHSIPQLIEALRFELYDNSALANFIVDLASVNLDYTFEVYWQLQQRIDHSAIDDLPYAVRCQNLQQKIVNEHDFINLRKDLKLQHDLLSDLDRIQDELRSRPQDSEQEKIHRLRLRLGVLDAKLLQCKMRLPIAPSFDCTGVWVEECSIFNSNAKPLKIVFRGMNRSYSIIHKRDDDMRQDAFVMKMVNEMDRIWKSNGLDLCIITFRVMPVGYRKGMGELVLNCATLLEIQKEDGLRGVLKDEILQQWLQKHNNSEYTYGKALDNFIRSCAGWCVVTYVLGIGDRHNDNILFTKNGHVFHIDFGKYMGDWQMAAGFRRDRVPFVFTTEMYYVINGGRTQTQSYQKFIDYCCVALKHLRRNRTTLANLLRIMGCSDIAGINLDSIAFVDKNLMLDLSDTDATAQFTELIQNSLKSTFVRLNFVAHTFAQFMSSSSSFSKRDEDKLSIAPELYRKGFSQTRFICIKSKFDGKNLAVSSYVYRSFAEFDELYSKLRRRFPNVIFSLGSGTNMRSNVREVAQKRMIDVQMFLRYLFSLSPEISHCDLVYTFFHSILRDNKCDNYQDFDDMGASNHCQVFLRVQYNGAREVLSIFVGHVKNLSLLQTGQEPDPYVKTYVKPDLQNFAKRKTQVVRGTRNPTFNQELTYEKFPESLLTTRVLEVSVWNNGNLKDNHKMYMVCIPLQRFNNVKAGRKTDRVLEGWFQCEKHI